MTKQSFIPSVNEDLNRPHKVTLTEGQISTILYVLEGYIQGNDDTELVEELEDICYRIDKKLEEKYKELDEINQLKSLLKEGN